MMFGSFRRKAHHSLYLFNFCDYCGRVGIGGMGNTLCTLMISYDLLWYPTENQATKRWCDDDVFFLGGKGLGKMETGEVLKLLGGARVKMMWNQWIAIVFVYMLLHAVYSLIYIFIYLFNDLFIYLWFRLTTFQGILVKNTDRSTKLIQIT